MAANDYYNNSSSLSPTGQPSSQHNALHGRNDAPLPPVPGNNPSTQSISPVASPFDDNRYEYTQNSNYSSGALGGAGAAGTGYGADTAYHGGSPDTPFNNHNNRYDPPINSSDPFADQNAIPLQQQGKMDHHGTPTHYNPGDPEAAGMGAYHSRSEKPKKKKGLFNGRVTWFVYVMTAVQVGVFVGELIKNGMLTGSPIQTKPNFNIMIGPSPYVLINMGARFTPCMHEIESVIQNNVQQWPCPNTTSLDVDKLTCSLSELCGMGSGVPDQSGVKKYGDRTNEPNQWWRFIVPIFLHAGLIHIGFNMLLQWTLGRDMEKEIGTLRFALVYFSSGIFGFVLGGNYAADGITSVGASGSLFGILALVLLDLLYNWNQRRSPVKDLLFLLLDIAIAFVLGLLPGLDNFSHIGGFLMGIALGVCLLHSPYALRQRTGADDTPYSTVDTAPLTGSGPANKLPAFVKQPVGFFKGRKPLWWAWWLVRAGCLLAVFIGFILLLRNFYEWRNKCSWCKHLTCLPISTGGVEWCDIGGLNLSRTDSSSNTRRGLDGLGPVDLAQFTAGAMGF